MPHFFFDVADGEDRTHDQIGLDLPNLDVARGEAKIALSAMAIEAVVDAECHNSSVTIRDGDGVALDHIAISLSIEHRSVPPRPGRS